METPDSMERRLNTFSLAVRITVALLLAASVFHCDLVLLRMPRFEWFFTTLSVKSGLPMVTRLLLYNWAAISVIVSTTGLIAVFLLFVLRRQVWTIPLAAVVLSAVYMLSQFAQHAVLSHLLRALNNMGT